ncbi:MAG: cysteine desulfurase [Chlamydiales bacterium]|nr:cysteine desulfurase [Chlamydiales bacterium]
MIYLDNNATTFLDPAVLAAVEAVLRGKIGNPSSIHRYGQAGQALLAKATKDTAAFFGVRTSEILFTSGATEALNMLICSIPRGSHIISSSLEHIAVMEALKFTGCEVDYLDPEPRMGAIHPRQVGEAVRPDTAAIVLTAANNETGVMTDLEPIAAFAEKRGIALIVDGVARLGKGEWRLPQGISAASFSGHKIHAPTGVGVALIRKSFKPHPLIVGGPQQHRMRGGTENVAGIVGFAKALTLLPKSDEEMATLRDSLEQGLAAHLDIVIHGVDQPRLCNTSNIAFPGVDGETLLMQLDLAGIAVSHGSACSSGAVEPSRVLLNMGVDPLLARSSIRFSLSRFTTQDEIENAIEVVVDLVTRLRALVN